MTNDEKLLYVGIFICFFISTIRIYNVAKEHFPPAYVNECVELDYTDYVLHGKILSNDYLNSKSNVELYLINPKNTTIDIDLTYQEMRDLNVRKGKCQ